MCMFDWCSWPPLFEEPRVCYTCAPWAHIHPGSFNKFVGRPLALCYAIVLPGRKSGVPARFRPDSSRGSFKIGPPKAGRRADFEVFPIKIWPKSGPEARFPARIPDLVVGLPDQVGQLPSCPPRLHWQASLACMWGWR